MDSSQSPLHDQRHKDDVVALVPGSMTVKARLGEPTRDANDQYISPTISPELIDATAEETCPAARMPAQDEMPQRAPAIQTAQGPSAITFELMSKLEALASDLAVKGHASSDQCIGNVPEGSKLSRDAGGRAVNPRVSSPHRNRKRSVRERQAVDQPAHSPCSG